MDGLLIEVLGLRGCGRRQVPTCACRINLQLHSRPLSFTLTVVVALFLFATFLPSRPFTASPSLSALLSHVPLFFSHRNPSLRSLFYLLFLSLSLSRALSVFVIPSFFPFFLKTLFIVFLFSHFHSHFSRFQFFHFLLSKIVSFLDFLSSVFSARTFIIFIDIYTVR